MNFITIRNNITPFLNFIINRLDHIYGPDDIGMKEEQHIFDMTSYEFDDMYFDHTFNAMIIDFLLYGCINLVHFYCMKVLFSHIFQQNTLDEILGFFNDTLDMYIENTNNSLLGDYNKEKQIKSLNYLREHIHDRVLDLDFIPIISIFMLDHVLNNNDPDIDEKKRIQDIEKLLVRQLKQLPGERSNYVEISQI